MTGGRIGQIRNSNDPYYRSERLDEIADAWWELKYENDALKEQIETLKQATQPITAPDQQQPHS
jgi:hypothetical protein